MINDALKLIQESSGASPKYPTPKFEKSESNGSIIVSFHNVYFPKGGVDEYAYIEFEMNLKQSKKSYAYAIDLFDYLINHSKTIDARIVSFTGDNSLSGSGVLNSISISKDGSASVHYDFGHTDSISIYFNISKTRKISNIEIDHV